LQVFRHDGNRGVCAAKNTGLDHISGDWFFIADSDDELLPNAFAELIKVPLEIDGSVNHVVCNIVEFESGQFLGKGFDRDQYWDGKAIYNQTTGEFKALMKTELLGSDRLLETVTGWEDMLWVKVISRSTGYYIHQGLYIVHKEGTDRVCKQVDAFDIEKKALEYKAIKDDQLYWRLVAEMDTKRFASRCIRGVVIPMSVGDRATAKNFADKILGSRVKSTYKLFARVVMLGGPVLARQIYRVYKKAS
jgi:glycosyltransferase involved in cell wall biosynthesis